MSSPCPPCRPRVPFIECLLVLIAFLLLVVVGFLVCLTHDSNQALYQLRQTHRALELHRERAK